MKRGRDATPNADDAVNPPDGEGANAVPEPAGALLVELNALEIKRAGAFLGPSLATALRTLYAEARLMAICRLVGVWSL